MVDIVGHANQNFPLTDDRFCSEAIGRNDILGSLAGRARFLYELLTGQNPFPAELPASTPNPQGKLGHDHSGPPWGTAFLHPVAWWSGQKADSGLQQPTQPFVSMVEGEPHRVELVLWNRPHVSDLPQGRIAPYSRLFLFFVAHVAGADADLGIRIENLNDGASDPRGVTRTVSGSSAGYTTLPDSDAGAWLQAGSGRNRCRITFTAADANAPTVTAWALCQVKKRTH